MQGVGSLSGAIEQMVMMLVITIIGLVGAKALILKREMVPDLSRMLIYITLPCMLLASINATESAGDLHEALLALVLAVIQFGLCLLASVACSFITRTPRSQRSIYNYISVFSNVSFIGLPVASAVYGSEGVVIASVFLATLVTLTNTVGLLILGSDEQDSEDGEERGRASRILSWRVMLNPVTIASLATVVLKLIGFRWPDFVYATLNTVGAVTTPMAMIVVGMILSGMQISSVVGEWRLYPFIAIREIIFPAVTAIALKILGVDALMLGVFTVFFAMPVGAMAPSYVAFMGKDEKLATKGTVITTLACFAIIPLLMWFLTVL